jgi:uncharacterized protein YaiI (UPF0178 family)
MKILVDADACPNVIKEILFRAAERLNIAMILVANRPLRKPKRNGVQLIQVESGFDVADKVILQNLIAGDLVITADVPLAAEVVAQRGYALNPRGELYTQENVQQRLTMRNFMETLRGSGQMSGGPAPLSKLDQQVFGNALDRFLAKHH